MSGNRPAPREPLVKFRLSLHGLIGFFAVILMLGITLYLFLNDQTMVYGYTVTSIVLYTCAVLFLSWLYEDAQKHHSRNDAFHSLRLLVGCHLVFTILVIGLFLDLPQGRGEMWYFIIAVASGVIMPVLLLRE